MIIESGVIIFLGMLLLALKLPAYVTLRALGRPFALDLGASALAFIMHYGTFSGVMAAAVAGLMCSGFTSLARYAVGYIRDGKYYPGKIWRLDVTKLK
ncbi:MAG: hypothetical protein KatS3mg015_2638 [Fimbriimonadales bacterium]|nr:MAG: hypothetical protein KatS3mg015_2638 [Fimbriimonadales bacterium]